MDTPHLGHLLDNKNLQVEMWDLLTKASGMCAMWSQHLVTDNRSDPSIWPRYRPVVTNRCTRVLASFGMWSQHCTDMYEHPKKHLLHKVWVACCLLCLAKGFGASDLSLPAVDFEKSCACSIELCCRLTQFHYHLWLTHSRSHSPLDSSGCNFEHVKRLDPWPVLWDCLLLIEDWWHCSSRSELLSYMLGEWGVSVVSSWCNLQCQCWLLEGLGARRPDGRDRGRGVSTSTHHLHQANRD